MDGLSFKDQPAVQKKNKQIHHDPSQQKERLTNNRARNCLNI